MAIHRSRRPEHQRTFPHPMTLLVTCDGDHGFLPRSESFPITAIDHPRDPAMRAGWLISPDGQVFCPTCRNRSRG